MNKDNSDLVDKLNEYYYRFVNAFDFLNILTQKILKSDLDSFFTEYNKVTGFLRSVDMQKKFLDLYNQYSELKQSIDDSKHPELKETLDLLNPLADYLNNWYSFLRSNPSDDISNALKGFTVFCESARENYVKSVKQFGSVIDSLKNKKSSSTKKTLLHLLQDVYPEFDKAFLYPVVEVLDNKVSRLGSIIDMTGSEVVVPVEYNCSVDYFKATTNSLKVLKEVEWLKLANQNYLTRIANAKLKGYVLSDDFSAIITKGTQNEFNDSEYNDFKMYIKTKERILKNYALKHNVDLNRLLLDPVVASVFNTAINHVFIGPYVDNKVLAVSLNQRLKSFELLEDRAKNSLYKQAFDDFRDLSSTYNAYVLMLNDLPDVGSSLIIHGDNRPGNLGKEQANKPYVLSRKIDFGAARLGFVSEDLSKLETIDNTCYVSLYNHIVKELNNTYVDEGALLSRVKLESFINNVRALSFALSKNNLFNIKRYFNLVYASLKNQRVA